MTETTTPAPSTIDRLFCFVRDVDVSGVSGTGIVATGVEFADGHVAIRWLGTRRSTVLWESIDDAIAIHGHDGKTRAVFAAYADQRDLNDPESSEPETRKCGKCNGEGQIANDEDGSPWSYWENLPTASKIAVHAGLIYAITCPECNGTGTVA